MTASAFELLHDGVKKAIFKLGWKSLHPVQTQSIESVLTGQNHLLICAQTAGGKTEAAFLPIISALATHPKPSVQALYIGPLIALINDQFQRLEQLCSEVDVPVHRWHGNASATEKKRLRDQPGGILLITPESLESNFINYASRLKQIYAHLDFVVVDEVHSFLGNVRGAHLRSLLARLRVATGRTPRVVGLSATLGDPEGAREFVAPGNPSSVQLIDAKGTPSLRLAIKAHLRARTAKGADFLRVDVGAASKMLLSLTPAQIRQDEPTHDLAPGLPTADTKDEIDDIAADVLHTCSARSCLVFGNAKQGIEVLADRLHQRVAELKLQVDPFHVHHGSLSKDVREDVEHLLKSEVPVTVLCSSTLELGIDIGSVHRVAQLDPPWSVAAMRQRLGRSGRREGEPSRFSMHTRDDFPVQDSSIADLLFPNLLRGLAMVRLMLERWIEPHEVNRLSLSTLAHQVLSCLKQTGGMREPELFAMLVASGGFPVMTELLFTRVLVSMRTADVIEYMATGEIILSPKGEAITASWDFYAAFQGSDEYAVRYEDRDLGKLASSLIPPPGENLILAGRRWMVVDIDVRARVVLVAPAKSAKPPLFRGAGGETHPRVGEEMRAVLLDTDEPVYLDGNGKLLLSAARHVAKNSGAASAGIVRHGKGIVWFPWTGSQILKTLELHAECAGLPAQVDGISIHYKVGSLSEWENHLRDIVRGDRTALDLATMMSVKTFEKFDALMSEGLLDQMNALNRIDTVGAARCAASAIECLRKLS